MAGDLKAQLEISADATGVETGVNKAKKSLADLGVAAVDAGKKSSDGLEALGRGSEDTAKKVNRATQNAIASLQRMAVAAEAGGKNTAKYQEFAAGQKAGVDVSALKPYLDQLDAVKARQAAAAQAALALAPAVTQVGMSARATAAALRGVPAQFTDIVTSLQGGQAPLTVFLQQGGQLKDMFGGAGNAARALGEYVGGLINPFTLAAAAVAALGLAYFQGSKEADAYNRAIVLSGNSAGVTVGQLTTMAQRIDVITGTQAEAAEVLAMVAASGQVAGDKIERVSLVALKMQKDAGQAAGETVKQFAELGRAPVEASTKLNETTNFLTASVFRQIKALEDQGRTADAAALAQSTYADVLDSRLAKLQSNLGTLERAWRSVSGAAKEFWDSALGVGRAATFEQQLDRAREKVAALEKHYQGDSSKRALFDIQNARDAVELLSEQDRLLRRGADAQAAAASQTKARIAFDKEGDKFLTDKAKTERAIMEARIQGAAAGVTQAEIEKRISDIRSKDKGAMGAGLAANKSRLGLDIEKIRAEAEQLVGVYTSSERIIESLRSAGLLSDKEYYESKRAFINLETQAKETAFQEEIERLQKEKLTGKDKIDNDKKVADVASKLAVLRADASSKQIVLSNQEAAANAKLASSYLAMRQSAQDYLDTTDRQQTRDLSGIGQGTQKRAFDAGVTQIEDRYGSQRRDLENNRVQLELEDKFTEDARQQYETRLGIINEFQEKSLQSYTRSYEERKRLESDWSLGAQEALKNYGSQAQNVFQQTEDLVSGAFKGMEDSLVSFVMTGKLNFKNLATSIIADIARIIIKQQISNALGIAGSGGGGGGFLSSIIGAFTGGPTGGGLTTGAFSRMDRFADGGIPPVGKASIVGERGMELFVPSTAGRIISNEALMGGLGGNTEITVYVTAEGTKTEGNGESAAALGNMIGSAVRSVIIQEKRPGGMLA
jgi:lambda family phage tail tape measure protein